MICRRVTLSFFLCFNVRSQGLFSNMSQILFDTRKQYLSEISILIPDNWKSKPEYEQIRPNQTLQTARVIIRYIHS